MSTDPKFSSDEFEEFDDSDVFTSFDDDIRDSIDDDTLEMGSGERFLTVWQRIEQRMSDRQLRSELADWDLYDEFPALH